MHIKIDVNTEIEVKELTDLPKLKIFIVGGGSILLCNEFTNLFPEVTIVVNHQFANAKSFLEILKVKYKS